MVRRQLQLMAGLIVAGLCWAATPAHAIVVTTLGEQDFNDGNLMFFVSEFTNAQGGEPAPIGQFIGNDSVAGANYTAQWTHTFDPADFANDQHDDGFGNTITGFNFMSLEFGIYDHDVDAPGSQVETFTINGVDVSPLAEFYFDEKDETTFGTTPAGDDKRFNIYRFIFDVDDTSMGGDGKPATAMMASQIRDSAAFQNGELNVMFALQEPSLAIPGDPTDGNGAGIDYSILRINTPGADDTPPTVIPEPATATLGLLALTALAARTRRRR